MRKKNNGSASDGGSCRALAPPMPVKGRTLTLWFWWKKFCWPVDMENLQFLLGVRISCFFSNSSMNSWTSDEDSYGWDQKWKKHEKTCNHWQILSNFHKECPWCWSEYVWVFIGGSYGFSISLSVPERVAKHVALYGCTCQRHHGFGCLAENLRDMGKRSRRYSRYLPTIHGTNPLLKLSFTNISSAKCWNGLIYFLRGSRNKQAKAALEVGTALKMR